MKNSYSLLANSYTMFGWEEKIKREKEVRESKRREKNMRNRVDLMCWLV
jgi:hypothetical protein